LKLQKLQKETKPEKERSEKEIKVDPEHTQEKL